MNTPKLDLDVLSVVRRRNITDVLHFTTDHGILGIGAAHAVLSRDRLDRNPDLKYIFQPNTASRWKDEEWADYVSLSISRVNNPMLSYSNGWHQNDDVWWLVCVFDAEILAHPDVEFVTTNNTYSSCLKRGKGPDALEALFAPAVEWGHYGSKARRTNGMPDSWTTDVQAEVLYPHAVPLQYLTAIYVPETDHIDHVRSMRVLGNFPEVPVECRPEVFA